MITIVGRNVFDALEARAKAAEASALSWSAALAEREREIVRLRYVHDHEMVRSETRYADLMTSYRLLRLQGYSDPTSVPPAPPAVAEDPIEQAVNRASRGMPASMRAGMLARARKEAETQPVEIVVQRIAQGHRPMDEIA